MSANETKLGAALSRKDQPKFGSMLGAAIAGAQPFELWTIPRLGIECAITLVSGERREEIESAVWERMRALRLDLNTTTEIHYELLRARHHAAHAVVDRVTHEPIGTLAEWGSLDDDVLGDFWGAYGAMREAYDPADYPLTEAETVLIVEAIKKKHVRLLRNCGARRLTTYLLSTASQPVSSPLPSSGGTSSQPDSSSSEAKPQAPDPAAS